MDISIYVHIYIYARADGHAGHRWSSAVRLCAAGTAWRPVIASAPWAARYGHTTVIDAASAIYVLGGRNSGTVYNDVWVSTDRGADRIRAGYSRARRKNTRAQTNNSAHTRGRTLSLSLLFACARMQFAPIL